MSKKRGIFGNPWVYLEASYQADRTYTSIVRAFAKKYPDKPYLPQLAGLFPIALMAAVRRVDGFHVGDVEIDFDELAERHFGHQGDPEDLALDVIEVWKGRDALADGFHFDYNRDTGIASVAWPAFAARYEKEVEFSKTQAARAKKGWKTRKRAPQASHTPSGATIDTPPAQPGAEKEKRATPADIREAVEKAIPKDAPAKPGECQSLSNKLTSDLPGPGKTRSPKKKRNGKVTLQPGEATPRRGAKLPKGLKPYPEDLAGPILDDKGIVRFLSLAEYQGVAAATPGHIPGNLVGVEGADA